MTDISTNRFCFQPVIIIGAARSGTNMLRDALTKYDDVATWPCDEINAIWRYRNAHVRTDELPADAASSEVRQHIRAAFQRLSTHTGARWIVEKTCANSLRVDFVQAVLPEAKYVFLVRDGRDVVASALKRWTSRLNLKYTLRKALYVPMSDVPIYAVRFVRHRVRRSFSRDGRLATWGPRFTGMDEALASESLAEVCARQWSACVLRAAESLARLPTAAYCTVRYESLVTKPREELARIAEFLAIHSSAEWAARTADDISNRSIGKWRTELSADSIAKIEPTVAATWRQLGQVVPAVTNAEAAIA
jgi:hypothetical protein